MRASGSQGIFVNLPLFVLKKYGGLMSWQISGAFVLACIHIDLVRTCKSRAIERLGR